MIYILREMDGIGELHGRKGGREKKVTSREEISGLSRSQLED